MTVWIWWKLSYITQFPSPIIQISWDPEKECLAWFFSVVFITQNLKNFGDGNQEQKFCISKSSKLIFNGSLVIRVTLWDPCVVHCQIILSPLILSLLSSSLQFISSPKFSATPSFFPTSLFLPPLTFHIIRFQWHF